MDKLFLSVDGLCFGNNLKYRNCCHSSDPNTVLHVRAWLLFPGNLESLTSLQSLDLKVSRLYNRLHLPEVYIQLCHGSAVCCTGPVHVRTSYEDAVLGPLLEVLA